MAEFIKKIKKTNIRQVKFFVLVITLVVLLAGFSIYTVIFLISNLNSALSTNGSSRVNPPRFEIERFEALDLRK